MRVIARKQLKRKIDDGKEIQFAIGGRSVQDQKIQPFINRKNLPQKDILEGGIRKQSLPPEGPLNSNSNCSHSRLHHLGNPSRRYRRRRHE